MTRRRRQTLILAALILLGTARAEHAPLLFNFQGKLADGAGTPLTSAQTVRFTLIRGGDASEPASSGTLVYQEDATVEPDAAGVFAHPIGSGVPVGGQIFEESDLATAGLPLYVEMVIGGETLLPRTRVLSTAYAVEASRLDGKSADQLAGQAGGGAFVNEVVRQGAALEWISGTSIRILPGTLGFPDARVRSNGTELTWHFGNGVGLLGLDQGAEASSTWYYLYAVPDPADDTRFSAVASTSPPPRAGGGGAAGYTLQRFLGSFLNNSGGNVQRFYRSGARVHFGNVQQWIARCPNSLETVDTWVTVDASGAQPETSRVVHLQAYYDAWSGARVSWYVSSVGDGSRSVQFCVDWQEGAESCDLSLPTENRTFAYYADLLDGYPNDAYQCANFYFAGYDEDLDEH